MAATWPLVGLILMTATFIEIKAGNYLFFVPDNGSHGRNIRFVAEALAARGHDVTFVIHEVYASQLRNSIANNTNYQLITLQDEIFPKFQRETMTNISKVALEGHTRGASMQKTLVGELLPALAESNNNLFNNSTLIQELRSKHFDLAFLESLFFWFVYIAEAINVPYVTMGTMVTSPYMEWAIRAETNLAYSPMSLSEFDQHMDYIQRVQNTLFHWSGFAQQCIFLWMVGPTTEARHNLQVQKSTFELLGKAEIFFLRTHFVLDFPRSLPPYVVPVGGLMATPPEPLQQDIESFVSRSGDHGVIIFSFGSYCKPMESNRAEIFIGAFSRLKQRVIIKHGGATIPELSNNTLTLPWLPQNDLLGHTRTKLFISHCGSNGVFEALYHAVPIICIPLFGDQFDVAQRVVSRGIGIKLDITSLTSSELEESILEVIGNKSFQANMNRLSAIYHDDPQTAIERVVYWMEYLVRHGGAKHLRSAAHDLNFLQYNRVDVNIVLAALSLFLFVVALKLVMGVCKAFGKCVKLRLKIHSKQGKGKLD